MKRIASIFLLTVALTACGKSGNPIAPTSNQQTKTPAPTAPAPAPTPAPAPRGDGGMTQRAPGVAYRLLECEAPCIVKFIVTVTNAPRPFHFEKPFAEHQDSKDGGPTNGTRPMANWFIVESGPTDYNVGQSGTTVLAFDTRQAQCGSVQLDQSIIYNDNGEKLNLFGWIWRALHDCEPLSVCKPETSLNSYHSRDNPLDSSKMDVVFDARDEAVNHAFYAPSYGATRNQFFPQTRVAEEFIYAHAGENIITVRKALEYECQQIDLTCVPGPAVMTSDWMNHENSIDGWSMCR